MRKRNKLDKLFISDILSNTTSSGIGKCNQKHTQKITGRLSILGKLSFFVPRLARSPRSGLCPQGSGVNFMSEEIQKSLKRDAEGNLVKTLMNLVLCFDVDENLQDLFHYNEFTASFEYAKDFQWPERTKIIPKGKRIEDEDIIFLQYYLCHNKQFEMDIRKIRNALIERADRKSWHPVKKYLDGLSWDGKERLNTIINFVLGLVVIILAYTIVSVIASTLTGADKLLQ